MRGMPHAQAAHDDVVNAVMTDHYIVRRQSNRDLLAPRREVHDSDETAYKGEVVLLYPRQPPATGIIPLSRRAQVTDGANLKAGISRLERSIAAYSRNRRILPRIGNAYTKTRQHNKAFHWYEEAIRRNRSLFRPAQLRRRACQSGRAADVVKVLGAAQATAGQIPRC